VLTGGYPAALFQQLDKDWQTYALSAQENGLGLVVPPVLGIVLTRCASRDAIPTVIADLRIEWSDARKKVWQTVDALKASKTIAESRKIQRELAEASRLFSPSETTLDSRPVRVLWEIVAAAGAGAASAEVSGGHPVIGAATNTIAQVARSVPSLAHEFGPALFGRGAFDLAKRVRRELAESEIHALERLLTDSAKRALGFR
jgi:antitoxin component of RelBE/YafQ-DinJ toxin-antitoxin module